MPQPQLVEQLPNGAHSDHEPPPWQSTRRHGSVCRLCPSQSAPPYPGTGLLQTLARNCRGKIPGDVEGLNILKE